MTRKKTYPMWLIVGGSADDQDFMIGIAKERRYNSKAVSTIVEALEVCKRQMPNGIIVVADGDEPAALKFPENFRNEQGGNLVHLLYYSTDVVSPNVTAALSAGFDDGYIKPKGRYNETDKKHFMYAIEKGVLLPQRN